MKTDPIADMLTRIRNANQVKQPETVMPSSKLKEEIARILSEEGYLDGYKVEDAAVGKALTIRLRYGPDRVPVVQSINRVSKPGRRVYAGAADMARVRGGVGVAVVSTSEGLMSDRDARSRNIGGEILCEVW